MPALHILIADDQIPPGDMPEQEFRKRLLAKHGDNQQNRRFLDQCAFMGEIVQALRDSGYRVTTARMYDDAVKEISSGCFDLAIIDLGWYMDCSLAEKDRPAAGWQLCQQLDDKDERSGRRTPQILFSSRFPTEPELSREAARRQKLPMFKEATVTVRNSLIAAVGFVDATLSVQQSDRSTSPNHFNQELQKIALAFFKEPLSDYRRWATLTLVFVAISLLSVLAGIALAYGNKIPVATLSSITSLVSGAISALLYRRLASAQRAVEAARREILKQLQARGGKVE
jgi:CheY-like chemotaxis protein